MPVGSFTSLEMAYGSLRHMGRGWLPVRVARVSKGATILSPMMGLVVVSTFVLGDRFSYQYP